MVAFSLIPMDCRRCGNVSKESIYKMTGHSQRDVSARLPPRHEACSLESPRRRVDRESTTNCLAVRRTDDRITSMDVGRQLTRQDVSHHLDRWQQRYLRQRQLSSPGDRKLFFALRSAPVAAYTLKKDLKEKLIGERWGLLQERR